MDAIKSKFQRMGARVRVTPFGPVPSRFGFPNQADARVRIDVSHDTRGEFFDVRVGRDTRIEVVDVDAADRHLLLMARENGRKPKDGGASKFLCGHDERAWFVAAIPERARVSNVQGAKDALKPAAVWDSIERHGVRVEDRDRRRTAGFVRQGEWFFIPRPQLVVDRHQVLLREPIRRGRGKPHLCECLYREGGERVYVRHDYPNGLTEREYSALPVDRRGSGRWARMQRNARVYVRGWVRHPDHQTIRLNVWHEVVMNTETSARAMQQVAFLD